MELRLDDAPSLWRSYIRGAVLGAKRFPTGPRPQIPEASARLATLRADPEELAAYRDLCAFEKGAHLPVTFPHVMSTPVAAAMLVHSEFPYPLLGVVHVRQHIEQLAPIPVDATLAVHTWFGEQREVPRGIEFDTHTEMHRGHEKVWTGLSTALVRDPTKPRSKKREATPSDDGLESTKFHVPGDMGRRYARVTQDYNPIHLWPVTSRPFGFARPIVHGMWSLARCLAACADELPEAFSVDCEFRKPVMLPCEVRLFRYSDETGFGFSLRDREGHKKHLECTVRG